jgi:2-oxopent-4-enoate/cis-2-oxohex-4-enoate hydratase
MDEGTIRSLGDELYEALRSRSTVVPLTDRYPKITIAEAYRISLRMLERRREHGERVIGKKIGATSKAVQEMLDVYQPDFGFLTDAMRYPDGAEISIRQSGLIQPRAEGEIGFILKSDLPGGNVTAADVLEATAAVAPCFEIVDSRIRNWRIRIEDTIADNASCGVFVMGPSQTDPKSVGLPGAQLEMFRNGQLIATGLGSAVQGHPAAAVAWLANTLGRYGVTLDAGDIILSGSLVPLAPAQPGDVFEMELSHVGRCCASFV